MLAKFRAKLDGTAIDGLSDSSVEIPISDAPQEEEVPADQVPDINAINASIKETLIKAAEELLKLEGTESESDE